MARELGHVLTPIEDARAEILSFLAPLPSERCPLERAYNRVLREDLTASESIPPFDNSAMDGYAVRAADLQAAEAGRPVKLRLLGAAPAGSSSPPVEPGGTVRVMTGAPLPRGADAVVPHELTRSESEQVLFDAPARAGANVRRAGGDIRPGDSPLRAGQRLRGPQMAVAAALGRTSVLVGRRLRVGLLSPGDELVDPDSRPGPGQIRNSNQYGLIGLLAELEIEAIPLGIVPDDRAVIRSALRQASQARLDAVITTGGVSAGDHDYVQAIAREDGRPGRVFKVAMRPGKPLAFAIIDGIPLFGLPGNPASAIISFAVFARPALRRMLGEACVLSERFQVRFRAPYRYKSGRTVFLRARVEPDGCGGGGAGGGPGGGVFQVADVGEQDSSVLSSLVRSNALVVLPPDRDLASPDELFPAEWLRA